MIVTGIHATRNKRCILNIMTCAVFLRHGKGTYHHLPHQPFSHQLYSQNTDGNWLSFPLSRPSKIGNMEEVH